MPTKSAVEAAIGADDELGEELLESLRDTGMYNFASEFDVMQERMGTPDDGPGPSGLDTELAFNDEGGHVLGDLPSSAMKAAGEPIVVGLENEIVGKAAVTAATEAVNHARQRIDMVRVFPDEGRVFPDEDIFGFRRELSSPAGVCRSDAPHARAFRPSPASVGSDVPLPRGSFRFPDASTIPRARVSRFHPRGVWTRGIPRRRCGRRLGPPRVVR